MEKKTLISLVMIVKNEEEILRRALDSVKSIVDEYVIVDTGSTDSTKEIIKEYGELHEIPFEDFVTTKNKAIALAKGEYILFMDADEVVIEGKEFIQEWVVKGITALSCPIVEGSEGAVVKQYDRVRLWKNFNGWKFEGPGVHEYVTGPGATVRDFRIKVQHLHDKTGKVESYQSRFQGYEKILLKAIEKNPEDSRAWFYLGRTYTDLGRTFEAIDAYEHYLTLKNNHFKDERWYAQFEIACLWKEQGQYDKAQAAITKCINIDERRAEAYNLEGLMLYNLGQWETAVEWFKVAFNMPIPNDVILFQSPQDHHEIPAEYLLLCYDKLHQHDEAFKLAQMIVEEHEQRKELHPRIVNNLIWETKKVHQLIFMTLGNTPEKVYSGMMDHQGVGGVETTYLELSEELQKLGHDVYLFCKCDEAHKSENGVYYIPYQDIDSYKDFNPDVVITSRWFEPFKTFEKAKRIIWLQDAHFADPSYPEAFEDASHIICSSRWHQQYIAERFRLQFDQSKVKILPLSIRKELFYGPAEKDPNLVVYSSNPDRGLYTLLDMWEEITKRLPDIKLHITYGWEGLRTWSDSPQWQSKIDADEAKCRSYEEKFPNVKFLGRLTKKQLAEELKKATLCLYPNNFWETFCITALETQAAGTPMVTTSIGALDTTLDIDGNFLIDSNPVGKYYKQTFIEIVEKLMTNPQEVDSLKKYCLKKAKEHPTWGDVALRWQRIIWS